MSLIRRAGYAMVGLVASWGCLLGCAAPTDYETEEDQSFISRKIVNGQIASAFTEGVLVNADQYICSGALIAPRVVLTAGHCVSSNSYTIIAPYAPNKSANTSKASKKWTEYQDTNGSVNPNTNDVAVIILDTPITLTSYPPIATTPIAAGATAVNVGRVRDRQPSQTDLFFGKEVQLSMGQQIGFPFAYAAEEVIQSGDSGGPAYSGSGASRKIIAVNSGAGSGTQILARVDLAAAKIAQLIAENGGGGAAGGGAADGGAAGGVSGGPGGLPPPPGSGGGSKGGRPNPGTGAPAAPAGPLPPGCTSGEAEPNESSDKSSPLTAQTCGALAGGGDVDWFAWTGNSTGNSYSISLVSAGDAEIAMWKSTGTAGGWSQVPNTTPKAINATSNGAGTYVLVVRSASNTAQSYSISLRK